jgi:hypothetical protein
MPDSKRTNQVHPKIPWACQDCNVSNQPTPGWYDDPEYPGYLRYWDGGGWSEHRSPKSPTIPSKQGSRLSDVGDWLSQSFRTLLNRRVAAFGYVVASIFVSLGFGVFVLRLWDDVRYVDGGWQGVSAGTIGATGLLFVLVLFVSVFLYLVMTHQVLHARRGVDQPLDRSLGAAAAAMPRLIGWGSAIVAAITALLIVVGLLSVLTPILGVLAILATFPAAIWVGVKLSFFVVACLEPVEGRNPIQASADVSRGRFWPVLGRLVLVSIIGLGISFTVSLVLSPFSSQPSADDIDRLVIVENDELVVFDIGGILETFEVTGPGVILTALPSTAITLFMLSATAILFADTHPGRRNETPPI